MVITQNQSTTASRFFWILYRFVNLYKEQILQATEAFTLAIRFPHLVQVAKVRNTAQVADSTNGQLSGGDFSCGLRKETKDMSVR